MATFVPICLNLIADQNIADAHAPAVTALIISVAIAILAAELHAIADADTTTTNESHRLSLIQFRVS